MFRMLIGKLNQGVLTSVKTKQNELCAGYTMKRRDCEPVSRLLSDRNWENFPAPSLWLSLPLLCTRIRKREEWPQNSSREMINFLCQNVSIPVLNM